jgi:hypothetical protein
MEGTSQDLINISTFNATRKFTSIHEMGHRMADLATGGEMNGAQVYTVTDPTCGAETGSGDNGNTHSMRSEEYSSAAAGEGFAHFYAADVFNNHNEQDCSFEYYSPVGGDTTPVVNCETSNTNFPLRRHEVNCGGTAGNGVELDWFRTFWDVHTDAISPSVDATFSQIMNWIGSIDPADYSTTTAYDELDETADGEPDVINDHWDSAAPGNGGGDGGNGIDH